MSKKIVGIIGGIGPFAGLDMVEKIFKNTKVQKDEDHIPVILISIPELIADRTDYILGKSDENPANGIKKALDQLKLNGIEYAVIACNAAHSEPIFSEVKEYSNNLDIKLISIIESTANYLAVHKSVRKAAVFSVMATLHSQVYEKALQQESINTHLVDQSMAEIIHDIVRNDQWGIKAQSSPVSEIAREKLLSCIAELKSLGVDTIILGCTELPLAIPEIEINGIKIIDPTLITARSIVGKVAPNQLV